MCCAVIKNYASNKNEPYEVLQHNQDIKPSVLVSCIETVRIRISDDDASCSATVVHSQRIPLPSILLYPH